MAILVAIEGIDGSGKGTQVKRLASSLEAAGFKQTTLSFPQYDTNRFGRMIGRFLNGQFGELDSVRPELAALLFAGDRLESRPLIDQATADSDVVLLDRYVASNIAHQAGRLVGDEQRELTEFLVWLEHDLYGLPRPTRTFWLDLPVEIAQQRIAEKAARSYTERAADLQEEDASHLQAAANVYESLATTEQWTRVSCAGLSVEQTSEAILADLSKLLPGLG